MKGEEMKAIVFTALSRSVALKVRPEIRTSWSGARLVEMVGLSVRKRTRNSTPHINALNVPLHL